MNLKMLAEKFKPQYERTLTQQELLIFRKSPLDLRNHKIKNFIMGKAYLLLNNRRNYLREKKFYRIKEVIQSQWDFQQKSKKIDKFIEYDYKFF